jgi:hypothetical protein
MGDKRPARPSRSLVLFEERDARDYTRIEAQLLYNGDLRLMRVNAGDAVARFANEYISQWLWWITVDSSHLPALRGEAGDVLDVVREVAAVPLPADPKEVEHRFSAWLESKGVPHTSDQYDDYDD